MIDFHASLSLSTGCGFVVSLPFCPLVLSIVPVIPGFPHLPYFFQLLSLTLFTTYADPDIVLLTCFLPANQHCMAPKYCIAASLRFDDDIFMH